MPADRSNQWRVGNVKTISYCTVCVVVVGFILLVAGAIITGIAYTEVRPNYADENYSRYIRANLNRVVGPVMLVFGLVNVIGGCLFFSIALFSSSKSSRGNIKYNARASEEHLPDMDRKMLSQV